MIWNDPNAKTRQEVRDEKEARDQQAYDNMCAVVESELTAMLFDWEIAAGRKPSGRDVHNEAMRRLCEGACQQDISKLH